MMAATLSPLFCSLGHAEAGRIGDGGSHDGGFSQLSPLGMGRKKLPATRLLSPSNPLIKHCVKLRLSSSYRRACGSAIVIGLMPITEICRFQELKGGESSIVECLLLPDGTERSEIFNFSSTSVVHVSRHVMKKISGVKSVESLEAIAIMKIPKSFYEIPMEYKDVVYPSWFPFPSRLIVLDGIQGNTLELIAVSKTSSHNHRNLISLFSPRHLTLSLEKGKSST